MNKKSLVVNERRKRIKHNLIIALGGECCACGYNKYEGALEFHHIDPTIKEFGFSNMCSKSLDAILREIKKCVLLCSTCHKEVHGGIINIPEDAPLITEDFVLESRKK